MKLAEIKDLEIQELLDKEFADFEFDLFADCLRYGREDVFEAAVNCENPDREAYENIRKWRRFQSLKETYLKRPDLLKSAALTKEDEGFLIKIKAGEELWKR